MPALWSRLLNYRVVLPVLMLLIAAVACQCSPPMDVVEPACRDGVQNPGAVDYCIRMVTNYCNGLDYWTYRAEYMRCVDFVVDYTNRINPPPPTTTPTPAATSLPRPTGTPVVDCNAFRLTSPLDGLPDGIATFYWDALPGAQRYAISIYELTENGPVFLTTFNAEGTATNLTADVSRGAIGGVLFAYQVVAQAFVNDTAACTQEYDINREAPISIPPPQAPSQPVCGNEVCEVGEWIPATETGTCPLDCVG